MIKKLVEWTISVLTVVSSYGASWLLVGSFQKNNLFYFLMGCLAIWVVVAFCYVLNYLEKH